MQVHARREDKVMATDSDGRKRFRTLLDSNFAKKRKFDEEQDKSDRGSNRVTM